MSKKRSMPGGMVYSTDPSFKLEDTIDEIITLLPAGQNLQVKLDAKQRAGKVVTIVRGFEGKIVDIEELGKKLKTYCGTGGSVKANEIMIQGDNRDKIFTWLQKEGYVKTKRL